MHYGNCQEKFVFSTAITPPIPYENDILNNSFNIEYNGLKLGFNKNVLQFGAEEEMIFKYDKNTYKLGMDVGIFLVEVFEDKSNGLLTIDYQNPSGGDEFIITNSDGKVSLFLKKTNRYAEIDTNNNIKFTSIKPLENLEFKLYYQPESFDSGRYVLSTYNEEYVLNVSDDGNQTLFTPIKEKYRNAWWYNKDTGLMSSFSKNGIVHIKKMNYPNSGSFNLELTNDIQDAGKFFLGKIWKNAKSYVICNFDRKTDMILISDDNKFVRLPTVIINSESFWNWNNMVRSTIKILPKEPSPSPLLEGEYEIKFGTKCLGPDGTLQDCDIMKPVEWEFTPSTNQVRLKDSNKCFVSETDRCTLPDNQIVNIGDCGGEKSKHFMLTDDGRIFNTNCSNCVIPSRTESYNDLSSANCDSKWNVQSKGPVTKKRSQWFIIILIVFLLLLLISSVIFVIKRK